VALQNDKQEKAMTVLHTLLCLVSAASALFLPVAAHSQSTIRAAAPLTLKSSWLQTTSRSALGLNLGRSQRSQSSLPCASTTLLCDSGERAAHLYANAMVGKYWGVEVGYVDMGRIALAGSEGRAQGLNLSLIGKASLGQSLGVFGKLGTTYGRTETSMLGAGTLAGSEQGFGLSYGAGVSFALTPRLSATLEWDSNDLRLPGGGRDPVRSTSLGLQYRY
jgi:OOP family OmpA-OmpF porin